MKSTKKQKAFILSLVMVFQLLGNNFNTMAATVVETPSTKKEVATTQEVTEVVEQQEDAKTVQLKKDDQMTATVTVQDKQVNPLYQDIMDESMLPSVSASGSVSTLGNDNVYYVYVEDAAAEVREAMKLRQEEIAVNMYAVIEGDFETEAKALMSEIISYALIHTGVPTEGDYLMWQYGGWNCSAQGSVSGNEYYLTFTYTIPYYTTLEQEEQVDAKLEEVLNTLNVYREGNYAKICAIYDYICDTVVYDYDNLNNSEYQLQYTAYGALINGTSVCQGYAVLLYRMALELGIDSRLVAGEGGGEAHGWNIVNLGNYYYNVDSTWDAGDEVYSCFLKNEANFVDHVRYEEYATEEFYEVYPMGPEDYVYITSGLCGDDITWNLAEDGTLTLSGSGAMYDATEQDLFPDLPAIKSIVIEEGITEISDYAFYGCSNLQNIQIAETVERVGVGAFGFCESLTNIHFPVHVRQIGEALFIGCSSLTEITVEEDNGGFQSIDGVLYTENMSTLIAYPSAKIGDYEVPDGVRFIADFAFAFNAYPNHVTIPDTMEEIGTYAFAYMYDSLESITFIGSAPIFGEGALDYIATTIYYPNWDESWELAKEELVSEGSSLEWVCVDPSGMCGETLSWVLDAEGTLTITGEGSMYAYTSVDLPGYAAYRDVIQKIVLPDTLTHIGSFCFADMTQFTEIDIPATVIRIGDNAFARCTSLTSIHFSENVTGIGALAFQDCTAMTEIYFDAPVDLIESKAFLNVVATVYYDSATGADWSAMVGQNYDGTLTWVDVSAVPEAPATPDILSVYSKVQTSAKVTWSIVEGAEGYELFRATSPEEDAEWSRVKTIMDTEAYCYTNQGLTIGQTYYYKMRSYVTDREGNRIYSEFSEVDHMPAAVVFKNVYSNATYRVRLIWEEVGGAHGYQLWRMNEDGTYQIVKTIGDKGNELTNNQGATTAYSNAGLEAGKNYTYKMRAFYIKEDGTKVFGTYSDEITVATMPEAPILVGESNRIGRAQLNWDIITGAAGYQVWMTADEESEYNIVKSITDSSITSYTKYDLESGKTYYFKVRAYTEIEGKKTFGAYSDVVAIVVQ